MRTPHTSVGWRIGAGACGLLLATAVAAAAGQAPGEGAGRDLQGVWDFRSAIPFERPDELAGRATLSPEEAAAFAQERVDAQNVDLWRDENGRLPVSGGYNNFWYDRGTTLGDERRTSLVVDPPDGKIPARSAEAEARGERQGELRARDAFGPEDRGAFERCIMGFNSGPPMNPSAYNNNMQLFQTGDHVVILNEMVHDARVVPWTAPRTCPTTCASGRATRAAAGRATPWSSRPATSRPRPASAVRAPTCAWSSASPASTPIASSTSTPSTTPRRSPGRGRCG